MLRSACRSRSLIASTMNSSNANSLKISPGAFPKRNSSIYAVSAISRLCRGRNNSIRPCSPFSVNLVLEFRHAKRDGIGVVLIDMQSGGDVGQNRHYGGKTILEHQQAVLAIVKKCNVVIYDIVIDPTGSDEFANAYQLEAL